MTFYEQELQKLFGGDKLFAHTRIVGNTCYGRLTDDIRVKINFQTGIVASHYDRLKVTLLNRNEGVIDNMVLRFRDLWGIKQVSNPNFREGRRAGMCTSPPKPTTGSSRRRSAPIWVCFRSRYRASRWGRKCADASAGQRSGRKGVSKSSVYMGLCRRYRAGADHRLDLRPDCRFPR